MNTDVKEIPVGLIKPFIHRDRPQEEFGHMADSMKDPDIGLVMPIKVRDMGRKDKDGFRYELIYGEGRTLAARRNKEATIPAEVYPPDTPQHIIFGEFMNENLSRQEIPWFQKGLIVRNRKNAGKSFAEIAKEFHITEGQASKLYRVVAKTAEGLQEEVAAMAMNDAEAVTAHEPEQQRVVVQFAKETGRAIKEVMKLTQRLPAKDRKNFKLPQLRKEKERLDKQAETLSARVFRKQIYKSNGPDNIARALADPEYRDTYHENDVAILRFEAAMKPFSLL